MLKLFNRRPKPVPPPKLNMKPCPFCLGEQTFVRIINVSGWDVHQCHWCLATGPYSLFADRKGPRDPIKAWNTRR